MTIAEAIHQLGATEVSALYWGAAAFAAIWLFCAVRDDLAARRNSNGAARMEKEAQQKRKEMCKQWGLD